MAELYNLADLTERFGPLKIGFWLFKPQEILLLRQDKITWRSSRPTMERKRAMDYREALKTTPAPGSGCHPHLLRVANIGIRAGRDRNQIFSDTRQAIPGGRRKVPDREIWDAIEKAEKDNRQTGQYRGPAKAWKPAPPIKRPRIDADALRSKIMAAGSDNEADLWEASPTRLIDRPEGDAVLLLKHLYRRGDYLFIGDQYGKEVKTARDWVEHIEQHGAAGLPFIIPNPLTGQQHTASNGSRSYRCDAAVKEFRFALVEFDNMSRSDQLRFWSGWIQTPKLPKVACLIDSGNKSIHAWVEVNAPNREAWTKYIEQGLFRDYLTPMGVDPACRNESRLSRLPGHRRTNTGHWQRLLWLGSAPRQGERCAAKAKRMTSTTDRKLKS